MNKYYVILSIQLMLIAGTTIYADPDMGMSPEEMLKLSADIDSPEKLQQLVENIFTARPEVSKETKSKIAKNVEENLKKLISNELSEAIEEPHSPLDEIKAQKLLTYMYDTIPKCSANCLLTAQSHHSLDHCLTSCKEKMDKFIEKIREEEGAPLQQPQPAPVAPVYSPQPLPAPEPARLPEEEAR